MGYKQVYVYFWNSLATVVFYISHAHILNMFMLYCFIQFEQRILVLHFYKILVKNVRSIDKRHFYKFPIKSTNLKTNIFCINDAQSLEAIDWNT